MVQNLDGSKKRRRESVNVDTKLVEIYEDLANEQEEIRIKAGYELVTQFTQDKQPSDEKVKKALQRLFRGLCSNRKAARVGYSVALTEILSQVFLPVRQSLELSVSTILDIWEAQTNASGSETGQEQRDHYFGRLFGAEAIIKSSILFEPHAPFSQWPRLLDLVFDLARRKPWIREECGWTICNCFESRLTKNLDVRFVEAALDRLASHELVRTPEGVCIWLVAKDRFPQAKFPEDTWKHDDPLDSREKTRLAKIMKESSVAESENENNLRSSGVWNSKLHFAWEVVLSRLTQNKPKAPKDTSTVRHRLAFADFWIEAVDNGLFSSASSEERKYWGFLLFIKVVTSFPADHASVAFTRNLIRCLINQLAVEDRYLHRMAVKASKSIQSRVSQEPTFAVAAIRGLMGPAGSVNFDQVTKTKTVEKIVTEANLTALEGIVQFFEALVVDPGTDEVKVAASYRHVLAGLLVSIVRSCASTGKDADVSYEQILKQILLVFVRFGYFKLESHSNQASTTPHPALAQTTQELFQRRISSCLNSLITNGKYADSLPYAVVRKIRDAAKSGEFGKFIINMDERIQDSVKTAFRSFKKISSMANKKGSSGVDAFKLLYSLTVLQVYSGDSDAVSMLDELEFCRARFMGEEQELNGDNVSDASDILIEILLSFASKSSQLFRRMSEQVFGAFADQVTANGLQSLVSVLEAKENLAGQQEMFENQDDDDDDEEEEEEDNMDVDDDDSDVEVVDAKSSSPSDDDDDADSEADEEAGDGDDEELAAFEAKLAEALGTHRADQDLDEQSADSDADMNDDEMEALDAQLTKVFQARRQALCKKQDKKDARETMINFKNRVLDLLDIYVKKCHSKPLALDLLLPLLQLARKSSAKQLSTKASSVLREYTKLCKGASVPDIESKQIGLGLLRAVHDEAGRSGPPAHAAACSQASLLVAKILVAHDRAAIGDVVDVYSATRKEQLMSKRCHVQPSFFTDWNNWCVSAGKQLKQ